MSEELRARAMQALADRGWFPSAGEVPYDVALSTMLSFASSAAGQREALEKARDLIATIEQTNNNLWWVNADDPETAVCDTFAAVENALAASPSAPEERRDEVEDIVERILVDVAELPDRTSPEDQPDMMLVTGVELAEIIRAALADLDEREGVA